MKKQGKWRMRNPVTFSKLLIPLMIVSLFILYGSSMLPEKKQIITPGEVKDTIPSPSEDTSSVYVVVDQMPEFPGGIDSLTSYLTQKIQYPREALVDRVEGTVYVSFVVNTNGSTGKIKVIRGIHKALDRVAIDAVRSMPHWKAGKIKDKPVRTQINLPIRFMLPVSE